MASLSLKETLSLIESVRNVINMILNAYNAKDLQEDQVKSPLVWHVEMAIDSIKILMSASLALMMEAAGLAMENSVLIAQMVTC